MWGVLLASPLLSPCAEAAPWACWVTYGGQTQRIDIVNTRVPYAVEPVSIGGRFQFKAVHVRGESLVERIDIHVYRQDASQAVLIQHAQRKPPWPTSSDATHVDLMGEQHLYSGPLERELIYRCGTGLDQP